MAKYGATGADRREPTTAAYGMATEVGDGHVPKVGSERSFGSKTNPTLPQPYPTPRPTPVFPTHVE